MQEHSIRQTVSLCTERRRKNQLLYKRTAFRKIWSHYRNIVSRIFDLSDFIQSFVDKVTIILSYFANHCYHRCELLQLYTLRISESRISITCSISTAKEKRSRKSVFKLTIDPLTYARCDQSTSIVLVFNYNSKYAHTYAQIIELIQRQQWNDIAFKVRSYN